MTIQIRRCETLPGGCGLLMLPGATGALTRLRGECRSRGWRADKEGELPGTGLFAVFIHGPNAAQFLAALGGNAGFDFSICPRVPHPVHVQECEELPGGCAVIVLGADNEAVRAIWAVCARQGWDIWPATVPGPAGFLQAFIPGPSAEQLTAALAAEADFDFTQCPVLTPLSIFPPYGPDAQDSN